MYRIIVEDYNPEWKTEFEKARSFYSSILSDVEHSIEHVGSTSVPGLWAKPILDIDIVVKDSNISNSVIKKLEEAGYQHIGDLGVSGRESMKPKPDNQNIKWMRHNLYVCLENTDNLKNHFLIREHLRNNPESVRQYSELKRKLAEKFPDDINSYIDGKTDFLLEILKIEGMNSESLKKIEAINKKDK